MAKRFYNPGLAIQNRLQFDHPVKGDNGEVFPSYYVLSAPEHAFFDVPSDMEVPSPIEGDAPITVALDIWKRVAADYAQYGVVLVDSQIKSLKGGGNIAKTPAEAQTKGDQIWREHLYSLVRGHQQGVKDARQSNLVPRYAVGPVAHALKVLNIEDPAGDVADVVQKKEDMGEVAKLKATIATMQSQMNQLLTNLTAPKGK